MVVDSAAFIRTISHLKISVYYCLYSILDGDNIRTSK